MQASRNFKDLFIAQLVYGFQTDAPSREAMMASVAGSKAQVRGTGLDTTCGILP
jgi:hypothetical protein